MKEFITKELEDALKEWIKTNTRQNAARKRFKKMLVKLGGFIGTFEIDDNAQREALSEVTNKENMAALAEKIFQNDGDSLVDEIDDFFDSMDSYGMAAERKQLYWDTLSKHSIEILKKDFPEIYQRYSLQKTETKLKLQLGKNQEIVDRIREDIVDLNKQIANIKTSSFNTLAYYDKTKRHSHFYIFSSDIGIEEAFVDACFDYCFIGCDLKKQNIVPIRLDAIVDIVRSSRMTIVEGKYGTGKTMLSKRVQLCLKESNIHTYYFDALDMIGSSKEALFSAFEEITEHTVIFIDGVDKLVCMNSNYAELERFCEDMSRAIQDNEYVSFVVNTREYYNIGCSGIESQTYISGLLASSLLLEIGQKKLDIVITKGFYEKSKYEQFFENINPDIETGVSLTSAIVRAWHKKSPKSCELPLFAYAIGTEFYRNPELIDGNIVMVYEQFVQNTIRGRFSEESLPGTIDGDLQNKYESLLQKVAVNMIHAMRININYKEDTLVEELKDDEIYAISVSDFDDEVQKEVGELYRNSRKRKAVLSEAINNYFFSVFSLSDSKQLYVRFSDINIMSCFAAEYVLGVLDSFVKGWTNVGQAEAFSRVMNDLKVVELQPQVMDLLWQKIKLREEEYQDLLLDDIIQCLDYSEREAILSAENVRALLVLSVLAIRLQRQPYNTPQNRHFLKRFYRLCMTAKALNINGIHKDGKHRYLAERYFISCSLIGADCRRLNYKYYNFKGAKIRNATFLQCNFMENSFEDCVLHDVKFELCKIRSAIEKAHFKGVSEFCNSEINNTEFKEIICEEDEHGEATLVFSNCSMTGVSINITKEKTTLVFRDCRLNDVKIKDCKKTVVVDVQRCIGNRIRNEGSEKVYSDSDFIDGEVRPMRYLNQ